MSSPVQIGTDVAVLQLPILLGVLPWDHVLEPGWHVFFDPPGEANAVLQRDVADMVDGERDFHADNVADLGNVLLKQVEALVGKVEAGERDGGTLCAS